MVLFCMYSARLSNLVLLAAIGTKVAQLGPNQVYQTDSGDIVIDVAELQVNIQNRVFLLDRVAPQLH